MTTPPQPPRSAERRAKHRRRLLLGVPAVLLAVALAATAGWLVLLKRGPETALTFTGVKIDAPAEVLTRAEATVAALVRRRHGAANPDTRCYFAVTGREVARSVLCGSVQFVDGDSARDYLAFPFTAAPGPSGRHTLTPAANPVPAEPIALLPATTLRRPDGQLPGTRVSTAPAPPPADTATLTAVDATTVALRPAKAVMAAKNIGVRLTAAALVTRYGSGDAARSPAAGSVLLAFTVAETSGQYRQSALGTAVGVRVGPGQVRPLPATGEGQAVVVGAPADAVVTLVLSADGVRQTLTLPAGRPAATNLSVLTRTHLDQRLSKSAPLTLKLTRAGVDAGSAGGTVTAVSARLGWWARNGVYHAARAGSALLFVDLAYRVGGQTLGVDAAFLTITPTGGKPIKAADFDPSDDVYALFDVPGGFTTGTLTIAGSEVATNGVTYRVDKAVTVPISIPPG